MSKIEGQKFRACLKRRHVYVAVAVAVRPKLNISATWPLGHSATRPCRHVVFLDNPKNSYSLGVGWVWEWLNGDFFTGGSIGAAIKNLKT